MPDKSGSLPWKFSLVFERTAGMWVVTSPDIRGLMVTDPDYATAAFMVPKACSDLVAAGVDTMPDD